MENREKLLQKNLSFFEIYETLSKQTVNDYSLFGYKQLLHHLIYLLQLLPSSLELLSVNPNNCYERDPSIIPLETDISLNDAIKSKLNVIIQQTITKSMNFSEINIYRSLLDIPVNIS